MEYKDKIFALIGKEGCEWKDLTVCDDYYELEDDDNNCFIRFFVKVIGFKDDYASIRDWGHTNLKPFEEEPVIRYKIKTRTIIKKIKINELKQPETLIERVMARIGYYKNGI
jgi:hypothetical protein